MYNEELKGKFIKQYSTNIKTRSWMEILFNSIEDYEAEKKQDICMMDAETLKPILQKLSGLRERTSTARSVMLREYAKWCIKNHVDGACSALLEEGIESVETMRKQTVKNPLHLQRYLDSICDPEGMETADNTLRCFYWMAYGGMSEEDILKVTALDVDLRKMVIRFGDEEYPIYRESISAFQNCMELTEFRYNHPNYSDGVVVYKPRAEGDTLLRGIRANPSVTSIRSELSRRSKRCIESGKTDMKLSYYRVWISGMFYRAYEMELAGVPVSFDDLASKFMAGKTYKLDSGRNKIGAKHRKIASDYLSDYRRWKETLSV